MEVNEDNDIKINLPKILTVKKNKYNIASIIKE
jgi:hypothetical protein